MAPAPPDRFVPRADEGERLLAALVGSTNDVVLCGPGGYGKTALASWACATTRVRERFSDGVLWTEIGQRPGKDRIVRCLGALAAHLSGAPMATYLDAHSAAQALRSALADRRFLLVVDDVWNADDLRLFRGLGDQVRLLITSRRTGLLDATEIPVGQMSSGEAEAVLGLPDAGRDELSPLLVRTGRWPLALGHISGVLRSLVTTHRMSVPQAVGALVEELEAQGITALDELSDSDVSPGIVRTLELSLRDLAETVGENCTERLLSLAAFPPGETIPYRLLYRLWGLSEVRARAEGDRFVGRSLAMAVEADGLRLHDMTREALHRMRAGRVRASAVRLLDLLRPAQGWHELAEEDWSFADTLAFHLRQVELTEELADTVRDVRFLARRIARSGPTAMDADLAHYAEALSEDTVVQELAELVRREGHLLTGGLSAHGMALTLESRCAGSPNLARWLRHTGQARAIGGLSPLLAPGDRDHAALVRSTAVTFPGEYRDVDWDPRGRFLAVAGVMPALDLVDLERGWRSAGSFAPTGLMIGRVRWSPDGTRLAYLGLSDRFSAPHECGNAPTDPAEALRDFHYDLSVLDIRTGEEIGATSVSAHFGTLRAPALRWSPDSKIVAVARTSDVCLWNPASDSEMRPLLGSERVESEGEVSLTWHPTHGLLAHTPAEDSHRRRIGVLRHWVDPTDQHRAPEVWADPALWGRGSSLAWRPHGSSVVLELDSAVAIADPFARRILWRRQHRRTATVHWSPDGARLALRECVAWPHRDNAHITLLQVPPDQDLASGAVTTEMSVISLREGHTDGDAVAWSPDGSTLATTNDQRVLQIWHTADHGPTSKASPAAPIRLHHIQWSPDGTTLAVAGANGCWATLRLDSTEDTTVQACVAYPFPGRDPATRHQWPEEVGVPAEQRPPDGPPVTVEFAPDGKSYVLGHWLQPLRIISMDGGLVSQLHCDEEGREWGGVCFTPSGDRLVACARGGSGRAVFSVWPVTGEPVQAACAESTYPREHDPGPDGVPWRAAASHTHAVVLAHPGLVGLFRLSDMQPLCWIKTNDRLNDVDFAPSGRYLAAAGDAALHLFEVHDPSCPPARS
jgi:WD40 repeat protein